MAGLRPIRQRVLEHRWRDSADVHAHCHGRRPHDQSAGVGDKWFRHRRSRELGADRSGRRDRNGPPVNSIPPVASGSTTNGKTVSSTTGTWSGDPPLTYSYQWQRCAPKCSNIAGATASTYKLTSADMGAKVRAVVTAANSAGSASADSNEVGPVQPTPAQISAAIRKVLAPSGKAAKIGAVLKAGGFTFTFDAPGPGKLTISWYQVPPGAHLARKAKPKPLLVATVSVSFAKAGGAKVKVKLTGAGRRLLHGSRTLKLTSKATLTPVGGSRTFGRRTFTLKG